MEIRDRLSVALVCMLIPIFAFLNTEKILYKANKFAIGVVSWVIFAAMILSMGWTTNYRGESDPSSWGGFGPGIAIAALVIMLGLYLFGDQIKTKHWWRTARFSTLTNSAIWTILIVCYLPSFLQFPNGMISSASDWSLNEYLGAITGHVPLSNFTAQYSNLLGAPLFFLSGVSSTSTIPLFVLLWINSLVIIELMLMAYLIRSMFPRFMYSVCFGIPTILIFGKVWIGQNQRSSLSETMTALPGRTLLPIVAISLLTAGIKVNFSFQRKLYFGFTGLAAGIALLNNFEFGATAAVAIFLTILLGMVSPHKYFRFLEFVLYLFGLFCAYALVRIIFALTENEFQISRLFTYSRVFGAQGFGSIPMPKFGLFIFIFSTLSTAAILGMKSFWGLLNSKTLVPGLLAGQVNSMFFGLWGTMSLLYYAGRSVNPGQLQFLLIPLSLAIPSILRVFLADLGGSSSQVLNVKRIAPLLLLWSTLPIVALLQAPNPKIEFQRLTNSGTSWSIDSVRSSARGVSIDKYIIENPNVELGYFGKNPNLTQLSYEIQSVMGVNQPYDIWQSTTLYDHACRDITGFKARIIIVPIDDIPESQVGSFCASVGLVYVGLSEDGLLHVYRRSA